MLFTDGSLAKRLENAEATLIEDFARAFTGRGGTVDVSIIRLGGGVAVVTTSSSPFNKVAGLGFAPLETDLLVEAEQAAARRGVAVRAEVATLANPDVLTLLTSRGYDLIGFENVLGRDLRSPRSLPAIAPGISVRLATDAESSEWIRTVTTAFLHPDSFDGPPPTESFDRSVIEDALGDGCRVAGITRYFALRDGIVAGGASMRIHEGVAQLAGAATLPEHRRNGVQTALLSARLRDAAERGCDVSVVTTEPASKSQQNVQREGFELLYARAVLVKSVQDSGTTA
jgi:GNAT superfamily N-acetyltransferase